MKTGARIVLAMLLASVGQGAFGQDKAIPTNPDKNNTRRVWALLQGAIDLDGKYQNAATLQEGLNLLRQDLRQEKKDLRIYVNTDAFREQNPDAPDVYETPIKFPAGLGRVPLEQVLRMAIAKIPTSNAALLVRRGQVEITTQNLAAPSVLMREPVRGVFENQPLQDVLEDLGEQTGVTILLDPNLKEQARTPITATLRGTIAVENAVRLLAGLADLRVITEDDALLVTRKKADRLDEGALDFKNRRLDTALRELAERTGRNIILDPGIVKKISDAEAAGKAPRNIFAQEDDTARQTFRVTASFRKQAAPENMTRILATMVDLSVVVLEDVIYVTDMPGANRLHMEFEYNDLRGRTGKSK